jgi:hypothetical protein
MHIPLLFWHCLDTRVSFPSCTIPYGQRNYHIYIPAFKFMSTLHHAFDKTLDNTITNSLNPSIKVSTLIRNIFVNPNIHDILVQNLSFSLITCYITQEQQVSSASGRELLQSLKWPVETLFVALQPVSNLSGPNYGETWNQYGVATTVNVQGPAMQNSYTWNSQLSSAAMPFTAATYTSTFNPYNNSQLTFQNGIPGLVGTSVLSVNQLNYILTNNNYPPLLGTFANPSAPTYNEIIAATPGPLVNSSYKCYFTGNSSTRCSALQIFPRTVLFTISSICFN